MPLSLCNAAPVPLGPTLAAIKNSARHRNAPSDSRAFVPDDFSSSQLFERVGQMPLRPAPNLRRNLLWYKPKSAASKTGPRPRVCRRAGRWPVISSSARAQQILQMRPNVLGASVARENRERGPITRDDRAQNRGSYRVSHKLVQTARPFLVLQFGPFARRCRPRPKRGQSVVAARGLRFAKRMISASIMPRPLATA